MFRRFTVLALLFLASCSSPNNLNNKLSNWHSQHIVNYSYDITWSCFCPDTITSKVHIIVKNSKPISRNYLSNNKPVAKEQYRFFTTIEGIFEFLQNARAKNAYKIKEVWNRRYDYPQTVFIDYIKDAVDDEQSFVISNFKILK